MTNEQILKKVIEKAIKNGWKPIRVETNRRLEFEVVSGKEVHFYTEKKYYRKRKGRVHYRAIYLHKTKEILFNHDFAKAFWGDEKICKACYGNFLDLPSGCGYHTNHCPDYLPAWQYHLQQMVLEKESLQYLKKFLKQT